MAGKSTSSTEAKSAAASSDQSADAADLQVGATERPRVESDCVVPADFHVGRAVNGKVCSYHAMHYAADGTRR